MLDEVAIPAAPLRPPQPHGESFAVTLTAGAIRNHYVTLPASLAATSRGRRLDLATPRPPPNHHRPCWLPPALAGLEPLFSPLPCKARPSHPTYSLGPLHLHRHLPPLTTRHQLAHPSDPSTVCRPAASPLDSLGGSIRGITMRILLTTTSYQDTPGKHHDLLASTGWEVVRDRGPLTEATDARAGQRQGRLRRPPHGDDAITAR